MDEPSVEQPVTASGSADAPPPPPPRPSFVRRHWLAVTVLTLLGLPALGFTVWSAAALSYSYSSGKRAGYVQKFSRKGWLCKTWEGTLYTDIAKGFRSDSFTFSVRNDSIAQLLEGLSGQRVTVDYEQHVGVPTNCFGETEYYITGVQVIPE